MWQKLVRALAGDAPQKPERRGLAVAVLLLETVRADFDDAPAELQAVRDLLGQMFGLAEGEVETLLRDAGEEVRRSVSLHAFVAELNATLDAAAKRDLIAGMWRVAHADGRVHPEEELLIRRLADLLYVPHREFISGKLAAGNA